MKKNVGKKFTLMAMLASLALIWGGVTACSNGSDDDGNGDGGKETTVKLKGNFFESEDEDAEWIYCTESLTETESGIWEGEITAVRGWDHFGIEVTENGTTTWYGAADGLEGSVNDAELVKDSNKNFWLATDKSVKSKVTVNLKKKTITVVDSSTVDEGKVDDGDPTPPKEFSFSYEASKIEEKTVSIKITVTDIIETTSDVGKWWFLAKTDDDKDDDINWKSGEGATCTYELEITDATKIAYLKKNGLIITGTAGLSAEVAVTQSATIDNGDDDKEEVTTPPNEDEETTTVVKIKGEFLESDSDTWIYCTEEFTEKEDGIWEAEITSVKTGGWDHFGVEVTENGTTTWYGAADGLKGSVNDAELVKDSNTNFWLATSKGGKSKVTVNLNTMKITVEAASES